jgi:hypothetical protein
MSNPTANFGWQMPTSTDLVTDLPADFEVFGQAVDTSLMDLKGGTTGQVLSKNSNTDMDFTWIAQDDSNAIQNAIVTAKGDLISATAASTPARLAVGTNGQVLQADSTTATGLKWASTSPTFVGCSLYKSSSQSITASTATAMTFDSENFDTDAFHSTTTNTSRITIPSGKAGYYLFTMLTDWGSGPGYQQRFQQRLYKNGVEIYSMGNTSNSQQLCNTWTYILNAAVSDYYELYAWTNASSQSVSGVFQCQFLGA